MFRFTALNSDLSDVEDALTHPYGQEVLVGTLGGVNLYSLTLREFSYTESGDYSFSALGLPTNTNQIWIDSSNSYIKHRYDQDLTAEYILPISYDDGNFKTQVRLDIKTHKVSFFQLPSGYYTSFQLTFKYMKPT